jgi:hypothetical protein
MEKESGTLWWVVSLIALVVLLLTSGAMTLIVIIALNGFTYLPDAIGVIYLVFTVGLVIGFSLLAGLVSKNLSQRNDMPLWRTGALTVIIGMLITPTLLCAATTGLLVAFGMI